MLTGSAIAALVVVVLPIAWPLAAAGQRWDLLRETAGHWLSGQVFGTLLANSLQLAGATALLATTGGTLLAVLIWRTRLPGGRAWLVVLVLPMFVPPYVAGIAYSQFLAPLGPLGEWLAGLGLPRPAGLEGLGGSTFLLTAWYAPLVLLVVSLALGAVDRSAEQQALLVRSRAAVLWHVTLAGARREIAAAAAMVFVMSFNDFAAPHMMSYRVLPMEIYVQASGMLDPDRSVLACVPGLVVCLPVAATAAWLLGRRWRRGAVRLAAAPTPLLAARWWPLAVVAAVGVVSVAVPMFGLIALSRSPASFFDAWADGAADLRRSVEFAAAAAGVIVALGAGLVLGRSDRRTAWLVGAALVAMAAPAMLGGVGAIRVFRGGPEWLAAAYSGPTRLVVGYVGRFVPIAAIVLAVGWLGRDRSGIEQARLVPAGPLRRLRWIHGPMLGRWVALAGLVSFVLAMSELELSILNTPPGCQTLAGRIFNLLHFGPIAQPAALCVLAAAVCVAPIAGWLAWRRVAR